MTDPKALIERLLAEIEAALTPVEPDEATVERVARAIEPETFELPRIRLNKPVFDRAYKRARAALSAIPRAEAEGWRPIESAPRDGTRIWAFFPFDGVLRPGCFAISWSANNYDGVENWTLDDGESACQTYDAPTHWQPLPAAPKEGS